MDFLELRKYIPIVQIKNKKYDDKNETASVLLSIPAV
jgi:hypothetical protein